MSLNSYFRLWDNWIHPEFTGRDGIFCVYGRLMECAILIKRMGTCTAIPRTCRGTTRFKKSGVGEKAEYRTIEGEYAKRGEV